MPFLLLLLLLLLVFSLCLSLSRCARLSFLILIKRNEKNTKSRLIVFDYNLYGFYKRAIPEIYCQNLPQFI